MKYSIATGESFMMKGREKGKGTGEKNSVQVQFREKNTKNKVEKLQYSFQKSWIAENGIRQTRQRRKRKAGWIKTGWG